LSIPTQEVYSILRKEWNGSGNGYYCKVLNLLTVPFIPEWLMSFELGKYGGSLISVCVWGPLEANDAERVRCAGKTQGPFLCTTE